MPLDPPGRRALAGQVAWPGSGRFWGGKLIAVALVAGAPHPDAARRLIDYLLSRDVERRLVENGWAHVPVRDVGARGRRIRADGVKCMATDLEAVYRRLDEVKRDLAEIFVQ